MYGRPNNGGHLRVLALIKKKRKRKERGNTCTKLLLILNNIIERIREILKLKTRFFPICENLVLRNKYCLQYLNN